jgi:serine/threonine-protein kinase RsbW
MTALAGRTVLPWSGPPWRMVCPGELAQVRELRRRVTALLPQCPGHSDMIAVVSELAANAVRHTASGRGGWFAVEIRWDPVCARITVADQGAPTGPRFTGAPTGSRFTDAPEAEGGRGLQIVRALSTRTGVTGGAQGRVVWAEVPWAGTDPQQDARPGIAAIAFGSPCLGAGCHHPDPGDNPPQSRPLRKVRTSSISWSLMPCARPG